jgi:hypothetical protein
MRMIKSQRMRWLGHVADMGENIFKNCDRKKREKRDKFEDIVGRFTLKRVLKNLEGELWIGLIWFRIRQRKGFCDQKVTNSRLL